MNTLEVTDKPDLLLARRTFLAIQQQIISTLEALDGASFVQNAWKTEPNQTNDALEAPPSLYGDGMTGVLEGGNLFERGVVSFSHVHGASLPNAATAKRAHLQGSAFEALGVSLVLHPENPYCPTVHLNVRLLRVHPKIVESDSKSPMSHIAYAGDVQAPCAPIFWFGGGMDLTPYYGFAEDAHTFHAACKEALTPFGDTWYPRFKQACDAYFFLKHRQEPRGIGGIFYDDMAEFGFEGGLKLTQRVGDAFLKAYPEIIKRRRTITFGPRERAFQAYRRGRYVEFNLALDRGTLFGLQSGGRTESILMSLPPIATWRYDWKPEPDSAEAKLYSDYLVPRDWLQPI